MRLNTKYQLYKWVKYIYSPPTKVLRGSNQATSLGLSRNAKFVVHFAPYPTESITHTACFIFTKDLFNYECAQNQHVSGNSRNLNCFYTEEQQHMGILNTWYGFGLITGVHYVVRKAGQAWVHCDPTVIMTRPIHLLRWVKSVRGCNQQFHPLELTVTDWYNDKLVIKLLFQYTRGNLIHQICTGHINNLDISIFITSRVRITRVFRK